MYLGQVRVGSGDVNVCVCVRVPVRVCVCYCFLLSSNICHFVLQLLSNAVVFLCGSVVGAFHKVLMEKTLRQTFQDTLRCLGMRMKLEIEKRQQVSAEDTSITNSSDKAIQS